MHILFSPNTSEVSLPNVQIPNREVFMHVEGQGPHQDSSPMNQEGEKTSSSASEPLLLNETALKADSAPHHTISRQQIPSSSQQEELFMVSFAVEQVRSRIVEPEEKGEEVDPALLLFLEQLGGDEEEPSLSSDDSAATTPAERLLKRQEADSITNATNLTLEQAVHVIDGAENGKKLLMEELSEKLKGTPVHQVEFFLKTLQKEERTSSRNFSNTLRQLTKTVKEQLPISASDIHSILEQLKILDECLTHPQVQKIRETHQLIQNLKVTSILEGEVDTLNPQLKALLAIKKDFPNLKKYKIDGVKLLGLGLLEKQEEALLKASGLDNTPIDQIHFSQMTDEAVKTGKVHYTKEYLREVEKFSRSHHFGSTEQVKEAILTGNVSSLQQTAAETAPETLNGLKKSQEIIFGLEQTFLKKMLEAGEEGNPFTEAGS